MNHAQNNWKHALLMLACCLIPIALILAVSVSGFSLGSLTPLLPYALALMCPLMMLFMMRGMGHEHGAAGDRKSTRLNSSHQLISYAVFCLKKKKRKGKEKEMEKGKKSGIERGKRGRVV